MKRILPVIFTALLIANVVHAQSIADGIKMLGYEKNKSAADILKKVYDANNKDPQAVYWYGQAFLAVDDIKGAKAIYQKALQDGVNDPWILIGMGHVELMEGGDVNSAKQKFEQAITMAKEPKGKNKGKTNPAILDAIGRANADGGSKIGDPSYGIDKLKEAAALDPTSADIMINMGINYLKMGSDQGGEAVKAYNDAAAREPKNPIPAYRIGKVYQSQNNKDLFEQYYSTAIAADPAFPPVYLSLYDFYAYKDVNKAKDYIEKYIQYADKACETDYFYANYLFIAGNYQQSLDKAKAMDASDCKSYYRNSLLFAYNYDRLGDSLQAKNYIEKYFANAPADKIRNSDYEVAVKIYAKFPDSISTITAISYLQKAIDADSVVADKVNYSNQAADIYGKAKKYSDQIKWLQKAIQLKGGSMGEADYYKMASTAYSGKDFAATMEVAKAYIAAFPEKPQGYYFNVRAAKALDSSASIGTAVEPILQQNTYLLKDTATANVVKNKKAVFNNLYYLLVYYNDKLKDTPKAKETCNQMLALYPDAGEENAFAVKTKEALEKSLLKPKPAKAEAKPKP
ncbi:tetratricopeptide repeat protein [Parasediminibacterium sp. JCM 36343]|uniref:tetratricopeptide repeat protein n=1 Tax=Parasediminibacterium sp. JCM 36343 TaxID=3374279 RepID=UPI0039797ED1